MILNYLYIDTYNWQPVGRNSKLELHLVLLEALSKHMHEPREAPCALRILFMHMFAPGFRLYARWSLAHNSDSAAQVVLLELLAFKSFLLLELKHLLDVPEIGVDQIFFHQLFVSSLFLHPALVENDDFVGVGNGS